MVQMFAPYGTLINDPKISKSGGKWAWTTVPGPHRQTKAGPGSTVTTIGVPKYTKNKEWALEFVAMVLQPATGRSARCSAATHRRCARCCEDPEMVEKIGWPPVAAKAMRDWRCRRRRHPVWDTLELHLRSALSQALLGQKTAKQALDELATDWQRACAAPASADDRGAGSVAGSARRPRCRNSRSRRASRTSWCSSAITGRGTGALSRRSRRLREADRHQGRFHPAADRCIERAAEGRTEFRLQSASTSSSGPPRSRVGWRRTWRITRSCSRKPAGKHPDFDWDDFLPSVRDMASYKGKVLGIPYRVTASVLNYQKQLLADGRHGPRRRGTGTIPGRCNMTTNRRRTVTVWASGAARDRRSWAGFRRSCAATGATISIRRRWRSTSTMTRRWRRLILRRPDDET